MSNKQKEKNENLQKIIAELEKECNRLRKENIHLSQVAVMAKTEMYQTRVGIDTKVAIAEAQRDMYKADAEKAEAKAARFAADRQAMRAIIEDLSGKNVDAMIQAYYRAKRLEVYEEV